MNSSVLAKIINLININRLPAQVSSTKEQEKYKNRRFMDFRVDFYRQMVYN